MESINYASYHLQRQIDERVRHKISRKFHLTHPLIKRLGVIHELKGHGGCVNCLQWNDTGDILASGSDDCYIKLWDPYKKKCIKGLPSGHQDNIFSVKFLETTHKNNIVSGAGDGRVRIHDLISMENLLDCSCHNERVKRLAIAPCTPFMFWSGGEDGFVLQFDTRSPHMCTHVRSNVLINLTSHLGAKAKVKCIAINPLRPELLAVGANDPYVRLYDRRMISTTVCVPARNSRETYRRRSPPSELVDSPSWDDASSGSYSPLPSNLSNECVQYFLPHHLSLKSRKAQLACTYISFSPQGNELLANIGGEQIYLFDINSPARPLSLEVIHGSNGFSHEHSSTNGISHDLTNVPKRQNLIHKKFSLKQALPTKIDAMKKAGNEQFEKNNFNQAIEMYNKCLLYCPKAAVLYGNRAQALMRRHWEGDIYAALRDCSKALEIDGDYFRAHFRLARCLFDLKRYKEANDCYERFKLKFPNEANSHSSCKTLEKQIKETLSSSENEKKSNSSPPLETHEYKNSKSESGIETQSDSSPVNSSSPKNSKRKKLVISEQEQIWRSIAFDFGRRYCGHCNLTTDIKEANFFGNDGQYIVAGSDEGNIFIWDRKTTNIVRVLKGDESIVNCLQPHPYDCLLATSGIETVIRLWAPIAEDSKSEQREVSDTSLIASENQMRMKEDPLKLTLVNMGYRFTGQSDNDNSSAAEGMLQCRFS